MACPAFEYKVHTRGRTGLKAIYPGSFDPLTNGHLDVAERAARMFDELVIAVFVNVAKMPLFSAEERIELIRTSVGRLPNVSVARSTGLLVDYARDSGAGAIVKGLRASQDFEYEMQMALMNKRLAPDIETVFLMTNNQYAYVSSSLIRDLARHGASLEGMVPDDVATALRKKLGTPGE